MNLESTARAVGGNFHISTYQVYNGLELQRIKLFNQLELSDKLQSSGISECCKGVAHSEDDQEIIDSCFQISTQYTEIEKSARSLLHIWLCYLQRGMLCL